jgi:predicted ester cyclase
MSKADQDFATRWFEEIWNRQRRQAIGEMLAPDAVIHDGGETVHGTEGFSLFYDRMQATFSEMQVTVDETITQGDKLCARWSCTMKHTGHGFGMAPTGKALNVTGISIMRVAGGKLVEGWQNWDMLGLMQQIEGAGKAATYMSVSSSASGAA